jgi:hypothetical protein
VVRILKRLEMVSLLNRHAKSTGPTFKRAKSTIDFIVVPKDLFEQKAGATVLSSLDHTSDRHPVIAWIPLGRHGANDQLCPAKRRLRIEKLHEAETRSHFQSRVGKGLAALEAMISEGSASETVWSTFKSALITAAKDSLGTKRIGKRSRRWGSKEVQQLWRDQRLAYLNHKRDVTNAEKKAMCCAKRRQLKQAVALAKYRSWHELCDQIDSADTEDPKKFHKLIRFLCNKGTPEKDVAISLDHMAEHWSKLLKDDILDSRKFDTANHYGMPHQKLIGRLLGSRLIHMQI